jgi:hypothetical protein
MDLRRRMREMMMLSAILKGDQLEVKFHSDAPLDTAKLVALTDANRRRMRLTPSFQVMVRIETGAGESGNNYVLLFEQLDGVLQALAACEKLEAGPGRPAGPLAS